MQHCEWPQRRDLKYLPPLATFHCSTYPNSPQLVLLLSFFCPLYRSLGCQLNQHSDLVVSAHHQIGRLFV